MKRLKLVLIIIGITSSSLISAQSMAGTSSGLLNSVDVKAGAVTTVIYSKHGETLSSFKPYPFDGDWSFTWKGSSVDFSGVINLGNCQTTTDAGSMGGISRQTFFDFAHRVKGTGKWDAGKRTLTFEMLPVGRDDSRASTVSQSKEPTCEKIKGMFAQTACNAFLDSSPGLEGLKINFVFSEDLTRFEGDAILVQFGGKGVTESETTIATRISGRLSPQ
jgi:hypothetical protein